MADDLFGERSGAILSDDGVYRYRLWRVLDDEPQVRTMVFVMLNPSVADAEKDDPTIRRCKSFARREGCNRIEVVNLYAYRATDPKDLGRAVARGIDIVGPDNIHHIDEVTSFGRVVAAWGASCPMTPAAAAEVLYLRDVECLGTTKRGHPRHPLLVHGETPLEPWVP